MCGVVLLVLFVLALLCIRCLCLWGPRDASLSGVLGPGRPGGLPLFQPERDIDLVGTDCASSIQSVEEAEAACEELPATLAEHAPPEPAVDPGDKVVEPPGRAQRRRWSYANEPTSSTAKKTKLRCVHA